MVRWTWSDRRTSTFRKRRNQLIRSYKPKYKTRRVSRKAGRRSRRRFGRKRFARRSWRRAANYQVYSETTCNITQLTLVPSAIPKVWEFSNAHSFTIAQFNDLDFKRAKWDKFKILSARVSVVPVANADLNYSDYYSPTQPFLSAPSIVMCADLDDNNADAYGQLMQRPNRKMRTWNKATSLTVRPVMHSSVWGNVAQAPYGKYTRGWIDSANCAQVQHYGVKWALRCPIKEMDPPPAVVKIPCTVYVTLKVAFKNRLPDTIGNYIEVNADTAMISQEDAQELPINLEGEGTNVGIGHVNPGTPPQA